MRWCFAALAARAHPCTLHKRSTGFNRSLWHLPPFALPSLLTSLSSHLPAFADTGEATTSGMAAGNQVTPINTFGLIIGNAYRLRVPSTPVLAPTEGAGLGGRLLGPSFALTTNFTNSAAAAPTAEAKAHNNKPFPKKAERS